MQFPGESNSIWRCAAVVLAAGFVVAVHGACSTASKTAGSDTVADREVTDDAEAVAVVLPPSSQTTRAPHQLPADVKWIDLSKNSGTTSIQLNDGPPRQITQPSQAASNTDTGAPDQSATQTAESAHAHEDTQYLIDRLRVYLRQEDGEPMVRALRATMVSALDRQRPLSAADTDGLDEDQREWVNNFHRLLTAVSDPSMAGGYNSASIRNLVDDLFGDRPITIRDVQLCRRVEAFGVYDAFETNTMMAGRVTPRIVYVELDHFASRQNVASTGSAMAGGKVHQVRVAQEVTLYDHDGLVVWRQPRAEITDESRNRRRDFFIVQLIRLPANLGVGEFDLKVIVTDLADGSQDEAMVSLKVVADPVMALSARPRQRLGQ
jgi:hypothetical protein